MKFDQLLRVTFLRSQDPWGFGGYIFSAKAIDDQGRVQDAKGYVVVEASATVLGSARVEVGQWWQVTGEPNKRLQEVNGYLITETQVKASSAVMMRPSGDHIIEFIALNPAFVGIGDGKARMLWDAFGESLYGHLDSRNVAEIAKVLTPESATLVVEVWSKYGDSRTLQWLQVQGIDLKIGQKILQFFGHETPERIQEDPYRLLSFCASWRHVDALARSHFGVALDDSRRLQGAIEEACYRVFKAGHTMVLSAKLMDFLRPILGSQSQTFLWRNLVPLALSQGLTNGSFVIGHYGVQPLGAIVMEREVAEAVNERISSTGNVLLPSSEVDAILESYQGDEGIELNGEQWQAVQIAAQNPIALITGGAGVGKTTVLKALYQVFDKANVEIVQLALAGRAAKRMQEATQREAFTIASFLHAGKELRGRYVVVVDEASMVDIVTMYRLVGLLGTDVRIVMAGDPEQLMPVGPGLVLHALVRVPAVPLVELKVVKRYGGEIAAVAQSIRTGIWPEMSNDETNAIAFIPCVGRRSLGGVSLIAETILDLYRLDPANTQILSARRNGIDGVKAINALCQSAIASSNRPVMVWSTQYDQMVMTGFHIGDQILCTRNMWDRGLQNGSLGTFVEIEEVSRGLTVDVKGESEHALAWVQWDDGVIRPVFESMLDDMELGYAITVHKAQGSQWPRVIVPLTGHRLLDRTMIYTAITRARDQVLIIGDEAAAKAAVERPPRVRARQVGLDLILNNLISSSQ